MKTGLHEDETVCIVRDVECLTRDGVILRGDAYLPLKKESVLTFLQQQKAELALPTLDPSKKQTKVQPNTYFEIISPHQTLNSPNKVKSFLLPKNNFPTLESWLQQQFTVSKDASIHGKDQLSFTTVLIRTPYDKKASNNVSAGLYWAQSGYACFIQDCRGRFASDGTFYKYTAEMNDGYDTVEWLAGMFWSNKKIVGDGKSYLTHTQMTLSLANPPHWSGSFAYMGGFWNAFTSGVRQGGCYETRQLVWAYKKAPRPTKAIDDYMKSVYLPAWLQGAYPWKKRENFLAHAPSFQQFVYDQSSRVSFSPFWEQIGFNTEKYAEQFSSAPVLFLAGWYDIYARSTTEFFSGLSKLHPKHLPLRYLVMGPWTHTGGTTSRVAGEVDFGPEAPITNLWKSFRDAMLLKQLRPQDGQEKLLIPTHKHYDFVRMWFDLIVPRNTQRLPDSDSNLDSNSNSKTTTTPLLEEFRNNVPKVSYFRMGQSSNSDSGSEPRLNEQQQLLHGGEWKFSHQWPLPTTTYVMAQLSRASLSLSLLPTSVSEQYKELAISPSISPRDVLQHLVHRLACAETASEGSKNVRNAMKHVPTFGPAPSGLLPWASSSSSTPVNEDGPEKVTVFQFDPNNPCPSIGGNVFPHSSPRQQTLSNRNLITKKLSESESELEPESEVEVLLAGAYDQVDRHQHMASTLPGLRLSARRDVICFATEPLKEDMEITGTIHALFFIASDCQDTDFSVKLIDEYPSDGKILPSGFDLNVTHGIQRCRYRFETADDSSMSDQAKETLLVPNDVTLIHVELYPTSNIFQKGHRIRIDISSSNFPHFDVNPNTAEGFSASQRKVIANNAVLHSSQYPSTVLFPVIPSQKLESKL